MEETLDELPEKNLDEIDEILLYETYIEKSLKRKIENLDDDEMRVTPEKIRSNLGGILEQIALKLQGSSQNFISLGELSSTGGQTLAEHLWKISGSDEVTNEPVREGETVEEDATARVGVRSLLTPVKTEDDTHKWPVDFCFRSMREYFVARGIRKALREDIEKAKELLTELPLNHEIIYFTAELMRKDEFGVYERNLLNLIRTTKGSNQSRNPGGNAVTLLFRLKGELPGNDWSGLNLDYANLSGANLSNKNFFGSSLRYANLDNVNFEGADFRECDLTGVLIEETAPVMAITTHPFLGDRIIAAYGDNTIREWSVFQRMKNESRIIAKNTNGFINGLGIYTGSDLCAVTNEEIIFYDFDDHGKLLCRAYFRMKPEYSQVVAKRDTLLLLSDEVDHIGRVLLVNLQQRNIVDSIELESIALCENLDPQTFVLSERKSLLCLKQIKNSHIETALTLMAQEVSSLCVFCCKKDTKYLLACGHRNGEVLVWQLDIFKNKWQDKLLLKNRAHDGVVSTLVFLDESRIISGGFDRKISILRFGPDSGGVQGIQERILHLTIKCKGMKIEGVKGDREREMLKKLISKA